MNIEDLKRGLDFLGFNDLPQDIQDSSFELLLGAVKFITERHQTQGNTHELFSVRQCIEAALGKVSLANEYCTEEHIGTSGEPWKVAHLDNDGNWQGFVGAACLVYALAKSNKCVEYGPISTSKVVSVIKNNHALRYMSKGDGLTSNAEIRWSRITRDVVMFIDKYGDGPTVLVDHNLTLERTNWLLCKN